MAQFFPFGSAFNESQNRLNASRAAAIGRVVSDTGFNVGSNIGAPGTSGSAGSITKQNEILSDFLQFTAALDTGGSAGRTGQVAGGGSGFVAPNIAGSGIDSRVNVSAPSRLLQSSGTLSRQFQTGAIAGSPAAGGGGGGDTVQASQATTDIQPVLEDLLAQLVEGGGTPQAQQNSATRQAAAASLLATVQQLTPANAEARAVAAVDLVVQRALEAALPQLQAAGESAGTSTNALQALAINDLATRTAGTTAAVILESISNFAAAQAQSGQALQGITEQDPVSRELLTLITGTPTERESVSGTGPPNILEALGIQFDPQASTFGQQFTTGIRG